METGNGRNPAVIVLDDHQAVSEKAAAIFADLAVAASRTQGRFAVALAGGSTPQRLYELLAGRVYGEGIPWPLVFLFWGDERCVPPEDADSDYRMVRDAMLGRIAVPEANVHPMYSGLKSPEEAAAGYEEIIRQVFRLVPGQVPQFDLVLLGLGADGHTASLFPHSAAINEKERLVVADYVQALKAYRLTLTLPVINNAAAVLFLVTGESKAAILAEVLQGPYRPIDVPAQLVRPLGRLLFLADQAAASKLREQ